MVRKQIISNTTLNPFTQTSLPPQLCRSFSICPLTGIKDNATAAININKVLLSR